MPGHALRTKLKACDDLGDQAYGEKQGLILGRWPGWICQAELRELRLRDDVLRDYFIKCYQ